MADHDPRRMRWWGWGADGHASSLPPHVHDLLGSELDVPAGASRPPVALEDVRLPPARLSGGARAAIERVAGAANVRDDHEARVRHCGGKGYPDLLAARSGRPEGAPDLVVTPADGTSVGGLLEVCSSQSVAVVPFGGGTSVVGGLAPLAGEHAGVVSLDLSGLCELESLDAVSLTAVVQAGMTGPALEAALGARGLTLGHFPQSFEYVTIGGCAATRSAGQASTGYGRIDDLVLGVTLETPTGGLTLAPRPASAAGPDLRQLVVGSEGILGVITSVALRLHHAPRERRYEGFFFHSFEEGAQAFRAAIHAGAPADVTRLSDEDETRLTLALAGQEGFKARAGAAVLSARGYARGCLCIAGWEGEPDDIDRRRAATRHVFARAGAFAVGGSPGRAWARTRFQGPYLRDDLMTLGVMVETLETAAQWSQLGATRDATKAAIAAALDARGTPALVGCHISHVYESGASLYFTFLARQQEGAEHEQWRAAKTAACDAIVAAGATITHHHAVGRDHAPWLAAEDGEAGIRALRALKAELDPAGIMNPGKLVGTEAARELGS